MGSLLGLFTHSSGDSVQCRGSARGKGRGSRSPVDFLFPGPTSSLPLDWSQLDADQRCARTHATHCPPPASRLLTLSHSTHSFCSLSIPFPQQQQPTLFSLPFRHNVTSTQPRQINKPTAGLDSSYSPSTTTIIRIIAASGHHSTTRVAHCGTCHRETALHCAAHRLHIFLTALQRQQPVINLFYTRWPFQLTTRAWS